MSELAERLSRFCTLLEEGELEAAAEEADAEELLTGILVALRGEAQTSTPDALERKLDALDDRMAAAGFGAVTQSERIYRPLPRTGDGHPVVHRWTCPAAHRCGRVPSTAAYPEAPICAVTGQPLVFGRVRL